MSNTQDDYPDARDIFRTTLDQFRSALTEEQRRNFREYQDAHQMILDLQNNASSHRNGRYSRLQNFTYRITRFSKSLEPYFSVIGIFVQAKPEITSVIWGSISMILTLCSHHATFLDKLEEMFDRMTDILLLGKSFDDLQSRNSKKKLSPHPGLMTAVARLHSDIIQFCCDIAQLFSRDKVGLRHRLSFLGQQFWKPFDVRFGDILKRLGYHSEMLRLHCTLAENITLWDHHDKTENSLRRLITENMKHSEVIEKAEKSKKVRDLLLWTNAPNWSADFKRASEPLQERLSDSGDWLLRHDEYRKWRDQESFNDAVERKSRLMFLAKPGFGKSVLCSKVLKDLLSKFNRVPPDAPGQKRGCVLYFFFDNKSPDNNTELSCFASLLAQLIHHYSDDTLLIDLATIYQGKLSGGQRTATPSDAHSILEIVLKEHPETVFVIDAVDECVESERFLKNFINVLSGTHCKSILFARPTISTGRDDCAVIRPELSSNAEDMKDYLYPVIDELCSSRSMLSHRSIDEIVSHIIEKADSMFLWVVLLVAYLRQSWLQPRQRGEEMERLTVLKGMEALFENILRTISNNFQSAKHRDIVEKLFNLVLTSCRPPTLIELSHALYIEPGITTTQPDLWVDPQKTIDEMSGALIEVRKDHSVRFIHLSVTEFLGSSSRSGDNQIGLDISLLQGHCIFSTISLSYLLYDLPPKPLSGSSKKTADRFCLNKSFPFLYYAATYWITHLTNLFSGLLIHGLSTKRVMQLEQTMVKFLSSRETVTVWTEAFWLYDNHCDVTEMVKYAKDLKETINQPSGLCGLLEKLEKFAAQLDELDRKWGYALRKHPNEIWEPCIPAFTKTDFWVATDLAELVTLDGCNTEPQWDIPYSEGILIETKQSPKGDEVGIIKVWPSREYHALLKTPNIETQFHDLSLAIKAAIDVSRNWTARYKVILVNTGTALIDLRLELQPEDIVATLTHAFQSKKPQKFRFPVSFSHDLRQIALLSCVLRVTDAQDLQSIGREGISCDAQTLLKYVADGNVYQRDFYTGEESLMASFNIDTGETIKGRTLSCDDESYFHGCWYKIIFSSNGRSIALLRGEKEPKEAGHYQRWSLAVLEDHCPNGSTPDFQPVDEIYPFLNPDVDPSFIFHPEKSLLVLATLGETKLWFFSAEVQTTVLVHKSPLHMLQFSPCGSMIHGLELKRYGMPSRVSINIKHWLEKYAEPHTVSEISEQHQVASIGRPGTSSTSLMQRLPTSSLPDTLESNNWLLRGGGVDQAQAISMRQDHNDKTVMLEALDDNGMYQSACLAKLPESTTLRDSYFTLIKPENMSEELRLIINKAHQETYEHGAASDVQLPALFKRNTNSISETRGLHQDHYHSYLPSTKSEYKRRRIQ